MGWLGIISQLLGFAPSIASIANKIADTRVALAKTDNDRERDRLNAELAMLENKAQLQAKESEHTSLNVIMRCGFAFPIIIVLWKILVWDQTLQLGSTPDLGDKVWNLIYIVASFYFLHSVTQLLKR